MAKKSSEFKVFQGPKRRLNLAIFLVLFISGPLSRPEIRKQVETVYWVYDGSLYRSLGRLVGLYLKILPPKKGAKRELYALTERARYALYSEFFRKQTLMDRASEKDVSFLLSRTLKILKNNSSPDEVETTLKKRALDCLHKNSNSFWD